MNIEIKFPDGDGYIKNLAFIRALLIKCTIEQLDISVKEKEEIKKKILEYLKNDYSQK